VDLELVPRFVDHVAEVAAVDLRTIAGTFSGTAQPIVFAESDEEQGTATPVELAIAHVKQVVYVAYQASYRSSLVGYGLLAADQAVRDRIALVGVRDYAGVNVELRATPPDDFALYSEVDVGGPDPNDLGLFGYDNTPGKDVGNVRLFDRIGGVNASTQADGYPGYGGVFVDNFLGFSQHPPPAVARLPFDTTLFDAVFDPLRDDRGGHAATLAEVAALAPLTDGSACPASDRATQVACAIFVLGNLVGTTLTHELGHSLGLANPYGDGYHDAGDRPNRLMDTGDNRPFEERAELAGQGPARFCIDEFTYLTKILPSAPGTDPHYDRPACDAP
jgi:hypothetical protein